MRHRLIACATLVILATTFGVAACDDSNDPPTFDKAAWIAAKEEPREDNPRFWMLKAVEAELKPGMSKDEVQMLLGPPDRGSANRFVYDLGYTFPSIDYQEYVIEFDDTGKLSRYLSKRL